MQKVIVKHKFISKDVFVEVPDEVCVGDYIVINMTRGLFIAKVNSLFKDEQARQDSEIKFVRIANVEDKEKEKQLEEKAKQKKEFIVGLFLKFNKEMKLVDIQYTLDDTKVVISYMCEDRVDFRDLVKELAGELKTRIELRQIGIRDHAKQVGCLGVCGKECCCKQYLNDFDKVSIKMAKTQNLSLNPTKISGTCGRLMCCLSFENDTYSELSKNCPKINSKISSKEGKGTVISTNVLKQTCRCRIEKGEDIKLVELPVSEVKIIKDNKE